MTDNVRALPGNISLNLDEEEVESANPFVVVVGGREISFSDPEDADWQELVLAESPYDFFRLCLSDEDREYLLAQELSGKKLAKLMKAFNTHFKIDDKIADARRQQARMGR